MKEGKILYRRVAFQGRALTMAAAMAVALCSAPGFLGAADKAEDDASGPASVRYFAWDASRLVPGSYYHYVYSDMDGKYANDYHVYVLASDKVEYLHNAYLESYYKAIDDVVSTLDRDQFNYASQSVTNLLPANDKSYRTQEVRYDYARGKSYVSYTEIDKGKDVVHKEKAEAIKEAGPVFSDNGSGLHQAIFLRFLRDDAVRFPMVMTSTLNHRRVADFTRGKNEFLEGMDCITYSIKGRGLLAAGFGTGAGQVWLSNDARRDLVKYTMNIRIDWTMTSLMLVLVERKPMKADEWQALKAAVVEKQKKSLDF